MKSFKSEGGVTVTDEMLNAWGEAAERGDYPGSPDGEELFSGDAPSDAEESAMRSVDVAFSPDVLRLLDLRAARDGVSRDALVQKAVIKELANA